MRTVSLKVSRRGFSLVEMLMALAISAALLSASLAALDVSFKSYQTTTESASTHVVSRIVMHRLMTLIRTGKEFGPYPVDVLDPAQNPLVTTFIEFVSTEDLAAGTRQITRIERRDADGGTYTLWHIRTEFVDGVVVDTFERPLITGLLQAMFTLEYDVGPRLKRATVDLTIMPNDLRDIAIGGVMDTPTIRMASSTSPRQLE